MEFAEREGVCVEEMSASKITSFVLFTALSAVGASTKFHHPPTFKEYQRTFTKKAGTNEFADDFAAQLKFFEAAAFTPDEVRRIKERGVVEELIGAGIGLHMNDSNGVDLLKMAVARTNSPVANAALFYRYASVTANKSGAAVRNEEVTEALSRFSECDPHNSLPHFLMASFYHGKTNFAKAGEEIERASSKTAFRGYSMEIRRCVVSAARAVDYPEFTAYIKAEGQIVGTAQFSALANAVATDPQFSEKHIRECLRLGRELERQPTFFIDELVGGNIQRKALKRLTDATLVSEEKRLSTHRDYLKGATAFLMGDKVADLSERRWLKYFNVMFVHGERAAYEELAREKGVQVQR